MNAAQSWDCVEDLLPVIRGSVAPALRQQMKEGIAARTHRSTCDQKERAMPERPHNVATATVFTLTHRLGLDIDVQEVPRVRRLSDHVDNELEISRRAAGQRLELARREVGRLREGREHGVAQLHARRAAVEAPAK